MNEIVKVDDNNLQIRGWGGQRMKKFTEINKARSYGKAILKKYSYVYNFNFRYGFVYFLYTDKGCKIGITSDLFNRLKTVKNTLVNAKIDYVLVSLLCENFKEIEKDFKTTFKEFNINNEWFSCENIKKYIQYFDELKFVFTEPTKEYEELLHNKSVRTCGEIRGYFTKQKTS